MRLVALYCTLPLLSNALVLPATSPLQPRRLSRSSQLGARISMGLDTSQVPKEIRDAESKTKTAEGRFLRFASYAVVGTLSIPVGLIYLSAVVGIEATQDLADALVPFNNLYVGIGTCCAAQPPMCSRISSLTRRCRHCFAGLDAGVLATCYWLWQQESSTRDENILRIWEEVQRRREQGYKKDSGKQGFTKKKKASRSMAKPAAAGAAGFASSSAAPAPPAAPAAPASAPAAAAPQEADDAEATAAPGGLGKMWNDLYDQADALGRAQALTLNSALEERGVLPKLETDGSGVGAAGVDEGGGGDDAASSASAPAASVQPDAAPDASAAPAKKAPKKKKKNKER